MIASRQHRFVFLKTRKTAGTSVEIALSRVCGPDDVVTPISAEDEELRLASGGVGPQNFTSPPLGRKVFNHVAATRAKNALGPQWWDDSFKFAIERNPWDSIVSLYHWRFRPERVADPPSFDEFVRSALVEEFAENSSIYRIAGEVAVDRVLRYESLNEELTQVWARLGLPGTPDLPRAKSGARPVSRPFQDYYSPVTRDRVAVLFAASIGDFGYEF